MKRLACRVQHIVLAELPAWQLIALAALVGVIWALSIFNWSFITGRNIWWQSPHVVGGALNPDIAQVLVGYFYYVQILLRAEPIAYATVLCLGTRHARR